MSKSRDEDNMLLGMLERARIALRKMQERCWKAEGRCAQMILEVQKSNRGAQRASHRARVWRERAEAAGWRPAVLDRRQASRNGRVDADISSAYVHSRRLSVEELKRIGRGP